MEIDYLKKQIELEEAIVRTIAFFDLFSYPLTVFEIWKYLDIKCELSEIMESLDNITEKSPNSLFERERIGNKNGFYFLIGREEIIKERMARYNYTDRKFKRAVWVAKIFKFIPWIKMIAIGNIIGAHNLKKESDIDFFIITENKRIWISRFFCVLIIKILGLRPNHEKTKDKICLSFFVSEEDLNLERLMLKKEYPETQRDPSSRAPQDDKIGKDIYFIYWLAGLTSIYDRDNTFEKFINKNDWLKNYLPNWQSSEASHRYDAGQGFSWFYRDTIDMFFGGLEKRIKEFQMEIMPRQIKDMMNLDNRVVVDDGIIKLHVNDRREEYLEKFKMQKSRLR
jgi:hypothetical protein